jgi:tRNA U34 5-carboxymethylaminomethyl modifying GTPase MnmE/TrmE
VELTWDIQTPVGAAGAVAIVQLCGCSAGELESALGRLGLPVVEVGRLVRRSLLGVDDGLLARWSPTCVQLMPHGGPVVVAKLGAALLAAGVPRRESASDPAADYPEARTEIEARMLATLARCASPRAIDLLLDQPRRWGQTPPMEPGVTDPSFDHLRNRLLRPPLVVAMGAPNVGKSTLVNALAGRGVSITADQPGTTRDHVGVELDLDGLVVHYVDTPGFESGPGDPVLDEARELALDALRGADLILLCGDSGTPDPRALLDRVGSGAGALVLALRADLGSPPWEADVHLSGLHRPDGPGEGLESLVRLVVETLVPGEAIRDPRPWRFWD